MNKNLYLLLDVEVLIGTWHNESCVVKQFCDRYLPRSEYSSYLPNAIVLS